MVSSSSLSSSSDSEKVIGFSFDFPCKHNGDLQRICGMFAIKKLHAYLMYYVEIFKLWLYKQYITVAEFLFFHN